MFHIDTIVRFVIVLESTTARNIFAYNKIYYNEILNLYLKRKYNV